MIELKIENQAVLERKHETLTRNIKNWAESAKYERINNK